MSFEKTLTGNATNRLCRLRNVICFNYHIWLFETLLKVALMVTVELNRLNDKIAEMALETELLTKIHLFKFAVKTSLFWQISKSWVARTSYSKREKSGSSHLRKVFSIRSCSEQFTKTSEGGYTQASLLSHAPEVKCTTGACSAVTKTTCMYTRTKV